MFPLKRFLAPVVATAFGACGSPGQPLQPVDFGAADLSGQLAPLGRAIGDSRIVLLGENGHGVGEFSEAKVRLVEWLHEEHGFEVVAFESGFFECAYAWNLIDSLPPADALRQCLRYPFEHAAVLPLFELIRAERRGANPLALAGVDIQAQGFDSEPRPHILHAAIAAADSGLASRVAALDTALFLLPQFGGLGDSVYAWAAKHERAAVARYDSAASVTSGWERWALRLATGWVQRLAERGRAEAGGSGSHENGSEPSRPNRYFELRDEWMARAVSALADSIDGPRKVVVWMHNDHARYGDFSMDGEPHRSTGGYLREQYGTDVFSIGFFMGRGVIADNGRNERSIAPLDPEGIESFLRDPASPATYLVLRDLVQDSLRAWSQRPQPYLRMGLDSQRLVPAEEFDALTYIDSVGPPEYGVR